jgi:hypothetical protein
VIYGAGLGPDQLIKNPSTAGVFSNQLAGCL